mmetsp:Transcript_22155/g.63530  ORF Transcript_22155/g.63530 Transcript_22155/m.63530 type:complete len:560 (+) Transcript_22155:79-1758(+)
MSVRSFEDALHEAHGRLLELADQHRREQDKLFHDLIAKFSAEASTPISEARAHGDIVEGHVFTGLVETPTRQDPDVDIAPRRERRISKSSTYDAQAFHTVLEQPQTHTQSKAYMWCERAFSRENLGGAGTHMAQLAERMLRFLGWLNSLKEPRRDGILARIVDGRLFSFLCFVVIALNVVFIVITTDYEITHRSDLPSHMVHCELAFMVFYAVELTLKLIVHRGFFLLGPDCEWNWLDLMLVLLSIVDAVILGEVSAGVNVSFMRSLRLFRLTKVLRVFRTVRFFTEMRLMFDCVLGSFISLVWCSLMILFVVYVFALLIVQGLAQDLRDPESRFDQVTEAAILDEFGSVRSAMLSLIECTTGGHDWGTSLDLLWHSDSFVPWAFMAYIGFFALAAWNIVTSIFVEKAMKLAQPDMETRALEQNMQDVTDAQELTQIFSEIDTDSSGTISLHELEAMIVHPRFRSYLRVRGIDLQDAQLFHRMLASVVGADSEDIDLHFVVAACLKMKGVATSMDLHALTFESKLLNRKYRAHIKDCSQRLGRIEQCLEEIVGDRLAKV